MSRWVWRWEVKVIVILSRLIVKGTLTNYIGHWLSVYRPETHSQTTSAIDCLSIILCIDNSFMMLFVVLHGLTLRYLEPLTRVADLPDQIALHSARFRRLHVAHLRLSTIGSWLLACWNNLLEHVTSSPDALHTFCSRLITHLMQRL